MASERELGEGGEADVPTRARERAATERADEYHQRLEELPQEISRRYGSASREFDAERWRPVTGAEIRDRQHPPRLWLAEGIIRQKEVARLSAPSKSFKSWFAMELAVSVATGKAFLDQFPVRKSGPVLIIQEEVAEDDYDTRLKPLIADLRDDVLSNLLLLSRKRFVLDPGDPGFQAHERIIAERGVVLVIYDNLTRMYPNQFRENEAPQMASLLGALSPLQDEYGVTMLLIHHDRKRYFNDTGASPRGSMVLDAFPDVLINIERSRVERSRARVRVEGRGFGDSVFGVRFDEDSLQLRFDVEGPVTGTTSTQEVTLRALGDLGGWKTAEEVAQPLGIAQEAARKRLERLAEKGRIEADSQAVPRRYRDPNNG